MDYNANGQGCTSFDDGEDVCEKDACRRTKKIFCSKKTCTVEREICKEGEEK